MVDLIVESHVQRRSRERNHCCYWIRSGGQRYHGWIWIGCEMHQMDFWLIQDCSKSDRWAHLTTCAGVRMKPFLLTLAPGNKGVACVERKVTRGA